MGIGSKPFRVDLVTPHKAEPPIQCTYAVVPAWDGEIGFLLGRSPLICKLGAGELRVETGNSHVQRFYVQSGFAEMLNDVLTVITERAEPAAAIDPDEAAGQLDEARRLSAKDESSAADRERRVAAARARLRVARKAQRGP